MRSDIHGKAVTLRRNGWSYTDISKTLNISKSTISRWVRDVPYEANEIVRKRIKTGPLRSAEVRRKKAADSRSAAMRESAQIIGTISKRDVLMLGIGLYMGEGTKVNESVRIINADPNIIKLAMTWFREILELDNENFRVDIHAYPDTNITEALNYWGKITSLPLSCFGKTQVDTRVNKTKLGILPFGTAHITVKSNGDYNKGVYLHRKIMGMIKIVYKRV